MEAFFERETKRVVFSAGRTTARAATKKEALGTAADDLAKVSVCVMCVMSVYLIVLTG